MQKTRVVLALDSPMLRELLRNLIEREPNVVVVDEVDDPVDLLLGTDLSDVHVVVHSWPDSQEMPAICTHLLGEYPDLLLIGIPPDAECVYACRQAITTAALRAVRLEDVIAQIRHPLAVATQST